LDTLKPIAEATNGIVTRIAGAGSAIVLPQILTMRGNIRENDEQRLQIRMTSETVLKGVNQLPLLSGFLGLAALLLVLSATWWREGR